MKTLSIIIICILLNGCKTTPDINNIPLKGGTAPYQIPAGTYIDTKGNKHIEIYNRWSVSEEWLYDYISNIKQK